MKVALALALVLLATSAAAQTATVVDGETLHMGGRAYRLHGIDAPDAHQTCLDGWPAGKSATEFMVNLVSGHVVTCEPETTDHHYDRVTARCKADGVDIEAEMVRNGMALAFVRYSRDYVALEAEAKAAKLGMHTHSCEAPWDWRAKQRSVR